MKKILKIKSRIAVRLILCEYYQTSWSWTPRRDYVKRRLGI